MSDFNFRGMSFIFKMRDIFQPPKKVLAEVKIEQGYSILDYGCGPGSYATVAAELVGEAGKVYALDIKPLAVEQVKKAAAEKGLTNIETILSDYATGLPDGSIDVVLLYDTLHDLREPDKVLAELHRVLKPGGLLSFSDHHLKEDEIVTRLTGNGLFQLSGRGKKVYSFTKAQRG
jgi:ubiquinone/menaquinone biosynthesis C-methylase UbiE